MKRCCLHCGEEFSGRADKKFCSDYCRSAYNYNTRSEDYAYVKRVNYVLRKNWNILKEVNPEGKSKLKKSRILNKGFNFNYHTNTYTNKNGVTYYYIYNMGYLHIDAENIAVMETPEYID